MDKEWSGQNWALLTLLMLLSTPSGVTSPTTVTFFVAISMSKELTPSILEMCFFTLPAHPLQCRDTLSTTTCMNDCWIDYYIFLRLDDRTTNNVSL